MTKKVLIMGLPGAGKTTLARKLASILNVKWFNADEVRSEYEDWDFSQEGRRRQAERMARLAEESADPVVLVDFVCPTRELREAFGADFLVWMDTIEAGRYEDTNRIFEKPTEFDYRVTSFDHADDLPRILGGILESPTEAGMI